MISLFYIFYWRICEVTEVSEHPVCPPVGCGSQKSCQCWFDCYKSNHRLCLDWLITSNCSIDQNWAFRTVKKKNEDESVAVDAIWRNWRSFWEHISEMGYYTYYIIPEQRRIWIQETLRDFSPPTRIFGFTEDNVKISVDLEGGWSSQTEVWVSCVTVSSFACV